MATAPPQILFETPSGFRPNPTTEAAARDPMAQCKSSAHGRKMRKEKTHHNTAHDTYTPTDTTKPAMVAKPLAKELLAQGRSKQT